MLKKYISFLIKKPILGIAAIAVVAGAIVAIAAGNQAPKPELLTVERGAIAEEVIVTGKVKPATDVDLAFERGGKIARTYVKIGDRVNASQTLAELDRADLLADLAEAEANVDAELAKLAETERGARPEEIAIQEVKVRNAEISVGDGLQNLIDKLKDAYTKSDDAVRNKADQLFNNPRSANPTLNITAGDPNLKNLVEYERAILEKTLADWTVMSNALTEATYTAATVTAAKQNLDAVARFLDHIAAIVNSLTANPSLSQTTIDGYRTDISTARTNTATAIANLSAAVEKFQTATSNLELANQELVLKKAGPTPEALATQAARVKQAQAKVQNIKAQIAKTIIRSPVNGIVTRQDATAGEIIAQNITLISVISESDLEIEVNVPEVDIGRIAVGNPVHITFDAYPGEVFSGAVTYIDPAETIVDGVVNFKVTIAFDEPSGKVRSGLTANLSIETQKKIDALLLPQFAIVENDQGTFVKRIVNGVAEEIPITVGIRSQNGIIEILSGLTEGDEVVNVGVKTSQ